MWIKIALIVLCGVMIGVAAQFDPSRQRSLLAAGSHPSKFILKVSNSSTHAATVNFKFRFTGSASADSTHKSRHFGP